MWCLETIKDINEEALRLALCGHPPYKAMASLGIRVLDNAPKKHEVPLATCYKPLEYNWTEADYQANKAIRDYVER